MPDEGRALGDGVQHCNEETLIRRIRDGERDLFYELIRPYERRVYATAFAILRNESDAEDAAQEAMLKAFANIRQFRAEARFSTWLYRIATNLGVNYARDTRHERAASTVYLDEVDSETGTTPDVADTTPDVEANLLRQERLNAIREHVMALPERQRMAVLMHKYDGMDYKQIGDVLKLSESATKSLLFRAYQTLRDKLKAFI